MKKLLFICVLAVFAIQSKAQNDECKKPFKYLAVYDSEAVPEIITNLFKGYVGSATNTVYYGVTIRVQYLDKYGEEIKGANFKLSGRMGEQGTMPFRVRLAPPFNFHSWKVKVVSAICEDEMEEGD